MKLKPNGAAYTIESDKGVPVMLLARYEPLDRNSFETFAHLASASPEMYAALIYAVDNPEFDSEEFDRLARAAIAKTRQEEN